MRRCCGPTLNCAFKYRNNLQFGFPRGEHGASSQHTKEKGDGSKVVGFSEEEMENRYYAAGKKKRCIRDVQPLLYPPSHGALSRDKGLLLENLAFKTLHHQTASSISQLVDSSIDQVQGPSLLGKRKQLQLRQRGRVHRILARVRTLPTP